MKITWLGHSCFLVEDSKGIKVITDPFIIDRKMFLNRGLKFDYPPINGVRADLVLISHDHFDHNGAEAVEGSPIIIRRAGDFLFAGVSGLAVDAEHDREEGRLRGSNLIMCWEMDGLNLCHFGDFGQAALREEQLDALGRVDILFIPVGGDPHKGPTLDAAGAKQAIKVLNPHLIFPMHYATPAVNFLQPVDNFLKLMNRVEEKHATSIEIDPQNVLTLTSKVYVLKPPTVE